MSLADHRFLRAARLALPASIRSEIEERERAALRRRWAWYADPVGCFGFGLRLVGLAELARRMGTSVTALMRGLADLERSIRP